MNATTFDETYSQNRHKAMHFCLNVMTSSKL